MDVDRGEPVLLSAQPFRAVMQWELKDHGPQDGAVQIQVGTLVENDWYVDHLGFGARRFGDKQAAWGAVRRLMGMHEGRWEQVPCDRKPWFRLRRSDGSRLLYDTDDVSLYECWGRQKEEIWHRYFAAISAGSTLRTTQLHRMLDGYIELTEYRDPMDGSTRYALDKSRDGSTMVIDYPKRELAEPRYEHFVGKSVSADYPFRSSDVPGVPVDGSSPAPRGVVELADGTIVASADLDEYERLWGSTRRRC
ncbi:MAG TPA: hypothetical protein VGX25_10830 [Actinophytocola sp.]|uniref:hypothetical protein n=1 Tax=Actinophytocola sp. TaxID=1872138 RepID=UPI002DDCE96E|nr:hypothetical protein [Actinophytocola sp.]HEV2779881.1 hypothetical protein [Actinophytocola sp.]